MAIARSAAVRDQIRVLFQVGPVGHLTDGQLLERFRDGGDGAGAAFEAIVSRHGPMVLSVCRQVLGPSHDAEDAFQATFLVLVRRAGSVRRLDSLGSWLHGVARRVSVRARVRAVGRRARERQGVPDVAGPTEDSAIGDLLAALHEEIARLPEKYRAPLVLCELGGRTHAEAACQLDWPVGTVSGRLSRARDLLRARFAGRRLVLSAGLIAAAASTRPASASLVASTSRACAGLAAGGFGSAALPGGAVSLARGILRAGLVGRIKVATGLLVAVMVGPSAAGHATGVESPAPAAQAMSAPPAEVASASANPAPRAPDVRSRPPIVLGWHDDVTSLALAPDGKTLATGGRDATVRLWDLEGRREPATLVGHSAPILGLVFSEDGGSLASADGGLTVKVWDVATGRERVFVTCLGPDPSPSVATGEVESLHPGGLPTDPPGSSGA